ncbi:MAG: cyclopropane-fatty-acyl-phospholipid synthase family protein [Candidatus Competibacteraceae bacterium]|jgi:cyclopropane-fatty-acyl-phospholipid synthase|nr:cyclopropane-fatty-acyl-phospholipid synthase family protein [Candidatus Competibacteraceae bacterium]
MNRNDIELFSCSSEHATESSSQAVSAQALGLEVRLLRTLLKAAGNPPILVGLWDGRQVCPVSTPLAGMQIHDRAALFKLLLQPDLQFGELYSAGRLSVEGDLVDFLEVVQQALPDFAKRSAWMKRLSQLYMLRPNTLARARENIHHHYDIGNAFYQLWLDEQMVYTCAYFQTPTATLEAAQIAKLDHVCRKLQLQPDEEVVEAGCGWGALALHMARQFGVRVKAYNISTEQLAFARQRAQTEGLTGQVEFIEGDYREISGDFDAFVSVGMLEHVGLKHYHELGQVIDRCLRPHGRGLIHTIGRNRPLPMNAWIEKRIFPGGYPPSLGEMKAIFEPSRFSVLDVENLRLHYAKTLEHWLARFEQVADQVKQMYDADFVRAWRFYLAGSLTTFRIGELQLFQVVFNRFNNNDIPWTREFLYR